MNANKGKNNDYKEDSMIWLDLTEQNRTTDIETRFRIKHFDSIDYCMDYITNINDKRILLIISGDITEGVFSIVHQCEQLKAIYLLNSKAENNQDWIIKYTKARITTVDQLLVKLFHNIRLSDERISFNTFIDIENKACPARAAISSNTLNIEFMYFHILIDIFLKMSDDDESLSKQDMINHLKRIFHEDTSKRKLIDELDRDYQRNNAIHWYTRDTFLYRLLNEALREFDFDILFALRLFIVDLYNQIVNERKQFCNKYLMDANSSSLVVYRGQRISTAELNILLEKQGGYFSMQSFLSTSTNPNVANIFSERDNTNPNETSIIYEFKIDTQLNDTKSYADIRHLSQFPDEDEILIAPGAVFHIESVQFDDVTQRWHAILTLCDDQNFDLYDRMKQYAAEIVADKVSFGFFLYQQGEYCKAKEYFQTILNLNSSEITEKAHAYRGLGTVAAEEQHCNEAYAYFRKELNIWNRLNSEKNIMQAYNNIGDIVTHMGRYQEALDYLQTAGLYYRLNDYEMEYARIYGQIGHIMCINEQWNNCFMCYELQLEVREKILHPNHEDIGITHTHMGNAYLVKKDYQQAIEHFTKALKIYDHSYQPDNPNYLKADRQLREAIRLLNESVGSETN